MNWTVSWYEGDKEHPMAYCPLNMRVMLMIALEQIVSKNWWRTV